MTSTPTHPNSGGGAAPKPSTSTDTACASHGAHAHGAGGHAAHGHTHGHAPAPVSASSSEPLIDPVCGMTVAPDSPHQALHDGQDFRFCSAGCRSKFIADPARYLTPAAAADTAAAPAGTQYTCPMHP